MIAGFQSQRTSGQPATGKTKYAIDVTMRSKTSARKVGSSGERMGSKIAASEMKGRCGARSERSHMVVPSHFTHWPCRNCWWGPIGGP
jgi:hypothetical protein